ncbi:glycosyltransferase family 39 protein [Roseisolibacter sp. H3M3-2]|uniref:glycosyltransferase family 39 protein n=1 Tax=Roseisolibacter sp. H3M3-2 TaxID=3031323 RepID=UPI0023DA10E1|nr:glycosyltransferase family 39 protein [Roseisolibacter sp. H3M3-2]MDF1503648.1 glycosyltransferase family 39 protein [Roseisolibacter sp. H3M3-2]
MTVRPLPSDANGPPARLPSGAPGSPAVPGVAILPAPRRRAPPPRPRRVEAPDAPAASGLALRPLLALAALVVGLHVAVNMVSVYALHRDELLYLAMGRHLRFWRMDFPPAIAVLAETTRALLGDTDVAIRLGPAVAHALLVLLAGALAHRLHGARGAQLLAAGTVCATPLFLRAGHLFQPVVLDQLWWTMALLGLVHLGRETTFGAHATAEDSWSTPEGRRRRTLRGRARVLAWLSRAVSSPWLLLALAGGLGLLTKFSIAFLAAGAAAALVIGPQRRALLTARPWLAALVALAIGAPSLVGQAALGWPVLGQMRELRSTQLVHVGVAEFLGGQLLLGPALLLALLGAVALLGARWARHGRTAGIACVAAFLLLLAARGKAYYAGPIYPLLFAAGAVALQQGLGGRLRLSRSGARRRQLGAAALIGAYGAVTLPVALPMLPPDVTARWAAALGVDAATRTNTGEALALPQDFADMLGWPQMTRAVGDAFAALPDSARADAAVLAGNYGQAGALEFYGPRVGIPDVISPAGSYWFFGPGDRVGDPLLTVGVPEAALRGRCTRLVPLGVVRHDETRWLVPEERDVPLFLCEQPVPDLRAQWGGLRPQ